MNKMRVKILIRIQLILVVGVLLFACSDESWNKHYNAQPELVSDKNLWTTIESTPELSGFAKLLKTYGYDKVLSQSQAYTVFAPNNDALAVLDTNNMDVKTELIENHIVRFIYSASGNKDITLSSLNGKRINLKYKDGSYFYGDASFDSPTKSIVASNGIVHVLKNHEQFFSNIWEYLDKGIGLDSIKKYMYSFDRLFFDELSSVPGSIVNGQQTYLDSVFLNYNPLLSSLGYINREDSSYTMLVPNNTAWGNAYNRIKDYYVYYNANSFKRDSLQRANTSFALVQDLIFNNNLQKAIQDSIVTTSLNTFYTPQYLFDGAEKIITSNGTIYVTNDLKIEATDSWHQTIKVEAERSLGRENSLSTPYSERVGSGITSISNSRYLRLSPTTSSGNPTVIFEIPGTLSSYYDIYCVFVSPKTVNPNITGVKSCKVYFNLNYLTSSGSINSPADRYPSTGIIEVNPNAIDTVLVVPNFKFPVANYGEKETTVKLKVISSVARTETANYSRELLIDCILLKPKKQ